jgi:hypothetical protein
MPNYAGRYMLNHISLSAKINNKEILMDFVHSKYHIININLRL